MSKTLSYLFCFIQILLNLSGLFTNVYTTTIANEYKTMVSSSNNLILCWIFLYLMEINLLRKLDITLHHKIKLYINLSQLFNSLWLMSYLNKDIYLALFNSMVLLLIQGLFVLKGIPLIDRKDKFKKVELILKNYIYYYYSWMSIIFFQNLSVILLIFNFNQIFILFLFIYYLLINIYVFGGNKMFMIIYYIYLLDKIFI